ncbi:MAG: PEGA domain-containing protein [Kofleriaceae bacterium]|nr:PEGA domain-containing protein [Kofleriaceae bacterium]
MHRAWRASMLLIVACSGDAEPSHPQPLLTAPTDAAADASAAQTPEETPFATTPRQKRPGRPIEIILRSTPSGAKVAVDGIEIGVTPTIWLGETGAPHEFTFVLEGHALARYRFVPVASGLVHPRLEPVAVPGGSQKPPPQMIAPQPVPPPTVVEPAPPTVTRDAAEVAPSPVAPSHVAPDAATPVPSVVPTAPSDAGSL